jgi:hypothetical protein
MRVIYDRRHRMSITETATINDIPPEVHEKFLIYLLPGGHKDLVASSLVNRAWYPIAQDLLAYRVQLDKQKMTERWVCGRLLKEMMCGSEGMSSIKHLVIYLQLVDSEYVSFLARSVTSSLKTLKLSFELEERNRWEEPEICFLILNQFFSQCHGIRNLRLEYFDFGDDPSLISQSTKDGFLRYSQLSLVRCKGDLQMFVERVPTRNLLSFSNVSFGEELEDVDNLSVIAINYPTIKRLNLGDCYASSSTLLKFVECCRGITELSYRNGYVGKELNRSDIEAIASLPRLKFLRLDCEIASDAISALSRCRGLKHLNIVNVRSGLPLLSHLIVGSFDLSTIIPAIGRKIVSLEYNPSTPILETANDIVEYCPNLQNLVLRGGIESELENDEKSVVVDLLKGRLKKLEKLKFEGDVVRLGTDWEGY